MKLIEFIGGNYFTPVILSSLFVVTFVFSNANIKGAGKKGKQGKQNAKEDKEMTINDIKNYKKKGWFS